jgi:hypothetical protein
VCRESEAKRSPGALGHEELLFKKRGSDVPGRPLLQVYDAPNPSLAQSRQLKRLEERRRIIWAVRPASTSSRQYNSIRRSKLSGSKMDRMKRTWSVPTRKKNLQNSISAFSDKLPRPS